MILMPPATLHLLTQHLFPAIFGVQLQDIREGTLAEVSMFACRSTIHIYYILLSTQTISKAEKYSLCHYIRQNKNLKETKTRVGESECEVICDSTCEKGPLM